MSGGIVFQAGEGEQHPIGAASTTTIKATADATAGRFFISENDVAPGFPGPPLHVHDELVDSFYVLAGTLDLVVGDDRVALGAGGFACVLPGTPHTFSNSSESRVRFLNINAPGGFEHYMRELAAAAGAQALTSESIGEIASRYDVRVVDEHVA
jgi:mannose-6-phosphate isomerase-like protein (cupin superfamily)